MTLMQRTNDDPKITRWWWRPLRVWVYALVDPLWAAFRGDNSDDVALSNVTSLNGVTAAELAVLDGLAATTAELNRLTGLTADAGELNKADRSVADGLAEGSRNVVLDVNGDVFGKGYDINQSLVDGRFGGAYLWFRAGDSPQVDMGDAADLDFGAKDFTLLFRLKVDGTADVHLGKGGQLATTAGYEVVCRADGDIEIYLSDGTAYFVNTAAAPLGQYTAGMIFELALVFDRGGLLKQYLNGQLQGSLDIASQAGKSIDTAASFYLDRLQNGGFSCYGAQAYNRALTAAEVYALTSGGPVPAADTGARQADLATNGDDWTGATGSTPPNSWSDSGAGTAGYTIRDNTGVANMDDKVLEMSVAGAGTKSLYQGVFTPGKRHRVSFVYRNLDGSGEATKVGFGSTANTATLQNTTISGDGVVFEQEVLADGTDLLFVVSVDGILQVDQVRVVQIGCAGSFEPDGLMPVQWLDGSGNEHHGLVSGAVPVGQAMNHVGRYVKLGITADTTLTDAVPAGYRIKSLVVDVSDATGSMVLNVGTTAGGTDLVNGQDISPNGLIDLSPAKRIFSLTAHQTLYVSDNGGIAWADMNIDLYMDLERMA